MTRDAHGRLSAVIEDFRRAIVSLGVDARGPFVVLSCGHKLRNRKPRRPAADTTPVTHRWCNSCANRSPYR